MDSISLNILIPLLFFLLGLSAFFSGSETALMSLNRYRLRHLADQGHAGAKRAYKLLKEPDRLIGLILLGNNLVNILVTQLATFIGLRLFGDAGIALATGILTLLLLIFAEVAPKTLGALHSEKFAFPAAFIYVPLLKIVYPLVWLINLFANGLLSLLGVPTQAVQGHALSHEELKAVVNEAGSLIHSQHQDILLRVLDMEQASVQDIMVPRAEIDGIDLEESIEEIEQTLRRAQFTRMPVYRGNINNIVGYLHMRRIIDELTNDTLTKEAIEEHMRSPYFIPESTSLTQQLLNFKKERRRHAMVVDEYGDIVGLVTMEDLLGEIVGEFSYDSNLSPDIQAQADGSFIVDGSTTVREINRSLKTELPVDGPRTINGLVLEYLEFIPDAPTSVLIARYPIEITKVADNAISTVRILPRLPGEEDTE
ncbi:MAG: HlyC/CorC family transporter [Thiotrichales bacterium]